MYETGVYDKCVDRGYDIRCPPAGYGLGMSSLPNPLISSQSPILTPYQRALFLIQCPIGILGGLGVYMSMPASILRAKGFKETKTTSQKLASIDYAGAFTLVYPPPPSNYNPYLTSSLQR